ncbi:MAG: hypothetical protein ACOH2F_04990 [Cellulomonas sp.]
MSRLRSFTSRKSVRVGGFLSAAALTATLVGVGVAGTGAYFTDTEAGNIAGTMGSIKVAATTDLNVVFTNMLPGQASVQTIGYANNGANAHDVWVVFPQAALGDFSKYTDIGLINDKGTYGEIHIKAGGTAVFDSNNLNDDATSCPLGSSDPAKGQGPCNPLLTQYLLASNLAPLAEGNMEFSYTPGAKYKTNQGLPEFVLPYTIVATQHGIAPDNQFNAPN